MIVDGYTLKLDVSPFERDVLVNALRDAKATASNAVVKLAISSILEQIAGYEEAVREAKEFSLHERHTEILRDAAKPKETEGLPKPECTFGYTDEQVTRIMGARLYDFRVWMDGQTEAICAGEGGCGPHGIVTYRQDVERFLLGLPVVD